MQRIESFLLDNERFEPADNWTALYCKRDDARRCVVTTVSITESKSTRETLLDGQVVPMLAYPIRPGDRLFMLIKGLKAPEGEIANALDQRGAFADTPQRIDDDPVSLVLGSETYEFRVEGLNLLVEERGYTDAQQSVPLFIDPDKHCGDPASQSRRPRIELVWMGDLDHDQRADFLIHADAYRSCALPILGADRQLFLILSGRGRTGEIGQVINSVGAH